MMRSSRQRDKLDEEYGRCVFEVSSMGALVEFIDMVVEAIMVLAISAKAGQGLSSWIGS
jgi:hypothetical protein